MSAPGVFVINEIDYDNVGTDTQEFIELYNGGSTAISLDEYTVFLINGQNNIGQNIAQYATYQLSANDDGATSLAPGGYLLIGSASVTSVAAANVVTLTVAGSQDIIQNGAPDGVILVNTTGPSIVDRLSYEGSITSASIPGFLDPIDLVEGASTTAADSGTTTMSLVRLPNGVNTNNASNDWTTTTVVTPGAANVSGTAFALSFSNLTDSGSSVSDGITNDNTFDLNLTGAGTGPTEYQISSNGGADWTATSASQSGLADGSYQFRAITSDAVGNSSTTAPISVTIDTTAPAADTITLDSVTSDNILRGVEADGPVAITGTLTGDAATGGVVTLTVNGTNFTGKALDGSFSIAVPGSTLAVDGDTTIEASVTASDVAGNTDLPPPSGPC